MKGYVQQLTALLVTKVAVSCKVANSGPDVSESAFGHETLFHCPKTLRLFLNAYAIHSMPCADRSLQHLKVALQL